MSTATVTRSARTTSPASSRPTGRQARSAAFQKALERIEGQEIPDALGGHQLYAVLLYDLCEDGTLTQPKLNGVMPEYEAREIAAELNQDDPTQAGWIARAVPATVFTEPLTPRAAQRIADRALQAWQAS